MHRSISTMTLRELEKIVFGKCLCITLFDTYINKKTCKFCEEHKKVCKCTIFRCTKCFRIY